MTERVHRLKNHKLGLFARMGGSFNRCFFILEMWGDELDPERISALLGRSPTKAHRKGDERPRGSQYYRTGGWALESGEITLTNDDDGRTSFESWLASLPEDRAIWNELHDQYSPRVRLVMYTDQMNAEFSITPGAASELSKRGLSLVLDPYLELDGDEA
jgi:hypothetical protein